MTPERELVMQSGDRLLLTAGVFTAVASLLHIAILVGGPAWYRFFGAGERMARLAARGSIYPAAITAGIAGILAIWALYALSGAGVIRRLPFLRPALAIIGMIYLARGILGVPMILLMNDPYSNELKAKMTFMVVSSAICISLGICYVVGVAQISRRQVTS